MLRALLALALVACASAGPTHTIGDAQVAFHTGGRGPARFVGFVNRSPNRIAHADVHVTFGMPLPGGDWLVMLDGSLVRFSPDGERVRWSSKVVSVARAVTAGTDAVIAIGTIADPTALNGQRHAMFRIDATTGALGWHAQSTAIGGGSGVELVRVGTTTIAASFAGATGVDDTGTIQWDETIPGGTNDPRLVAVGANVVIVRSPTRMANDFGETPLRHPLSIRVLDAATGVERGRTELVPTEDYYGYNQAGVAGDGRLVIDGSEVRVHTERTEVQGKPGIRQTSTSTNKLIVIDLRDPSRPTAEARAMPAITDVDLPRGLPVGSITFLDRYAAHGQNLGLRVLDLAANKIQRAKLFVPTRVHDVDAFVQVTHIARHGARLVFAGIFAGDIGALRGRIARVDQCAAQDYIECSEGRGEVTLSPFAGFIGVIE
ncbi:MAG: hypothetical protein SFX73_20355 [Kofleriaceae bacterium]|nr:hypothetical protein [Kofleriaceae bacterium]